MTLNFTSQTYTVPAHKLPLYGEAQQPSPASSASPSPANVSPTSPRLHNYLSHQLPTQFRQLRPPKTPLYVPAVLRPTEFPNNKPPPTPPKDEERSPEGAHEEGSQAIAQQASVKVDHQSPLDLALQREILSGEDLGNVTGPPKRDHWRPDKASPTCDSPQCRLSFGLFTRKHHCRHCGHIFCFTHTPYTVPLDQDAQFHPDGQQCRACEHCFKAYQRWEVAHKLRQSAKHRKNGSGENAPTIGAQSAPATPVLGMSGRDSKAASSKTLGTSLEESAGSAPSNWQWSTF